MSSKRCGTRECRWAAGLLLALGAGSASAAVVSPASLDLVLGMDEVVTEQVSLTIEEICVRAFTVDVVASHPDALVTNLTGVLTNGCGGDTSSFTIQLTGTGLPQSFDLQFVDVEFGGVIATLPVTIRLPPGAALAIPALGRTGFVLLSLSIAVGSLLLLRRVP